MEVQELLAQPVEVPEHIQEEMEIDEPQPVPVHEATTQTVRQPGTSRTVRLQVDMRPKGPTKKTKGSQTMPEVVEISTQTDEDFCPLCDHKQLSIQVEPIIPSSPDLPSSQPDPVSADESDYLPSSSQTPSSSDSERNGHGHVNHNWLIACLQAEQRGIVLAGDGRSDSPGHSAKYGTYTMLELPANVIIDMQLSNEVGGASHMEKEGFIRSVNFLGTQQGLDIDVIITDRHVQLRKWIRENLPDVQHLLDVWHVAKGLRKKLVALSKEKDCTDLKEWIDSIINHLYWSVMSTDSAEPNLVEAKWTSMLNHIVNIHTHNNDLFPKCEHKRLRGRAARKKWLKPCSTLTVKLEKLATTTYLIRDLKQASNREQTSSLEAFHSLLNHYAPKMYAFSYEGQLCRGLLAVMHFNENSGRTQQSTRSGELQYAVSLPKWKKGGHTVRKVLEEPTFDYVNEIIKDVLDRLVHPREDVDVRDVPPPLSGEYQRPTKETAVSQFKSRYKST
ncbi:uncharacterized protein LOC101164121 isoform X2 [Oryzias latipes]|uniref:uncharacterized protein LOC101164121 isoform X2 n=1 Tax=Oryzias latipes TaxID=8090 RepID=UPI000CE1D3FC|nr:uncharacterized protein LOC101164121 isoform X2 [Oryzias latipes]